MTTGEQRDIPYTYFINGKDKASRKAEELRKAGFIVVVSPWLFIHPDKWKLEIDHPCRDELFRILWTRD